MNSTAKGDRPRIAVFGRRNVGKSSLINKLTNQNLALVSSQLGTTTDPVYKAMEKLKVGNKVLVAEACTNRRQQGQVEIKQEEIEVV